MSDKPPSNRIIDDRSLDQDHLRFILELTDRELEDYHSSGKVPDRLQPPSGKRDAA